jgi:hypothetical protein
MVGNIATVCPFTASRRRLRLRTNLVTFLTFHTTMNANAASTWCWTGQIFTLWHRHSSITHIHGRGHRVRPPRSPSFLTAKRAVPVVCSTPPSSGRIQRRRAVYHLSVPCSTVMHSVDLCSVIRRHCVLTWYVSMRAHPSMCVQPMCKRLWCATRYPHEAGCRTQHMPWADGTRCAEHKVSQGSLSLNYHTQTSQSEYNICINKSSMSFMFID